MNIELKTDGTHPQIIILHFDQSECGKFLHIAMKDGKAVICVSDTTKHEYNLEIKPEGKWSLPIEGSTTKESSMLKIQLFSFDFTDKEQQDAKKLVDEVSDAVVGCKVRAIYTIDEVEQLCHILACNLVRFNTQVNGTQMGIEGLVDLCKRHHNFDYDKKQLPDGR